MGLSTKRRRGNQELTATNRDASIATRALKAPISVSSTQMNEDTTMADAAPTAALPTKARCVIIGGGVAGCSVAYHLAKMGWSDVVLLERKQLTCGTTWHAAGLLGQGRASPSMQKLAMYSADLYDSLEEETGLATGVKRNGSLLLAISEEREQEVRRLTASVAMNGLEAHLLSPKECEERYPGLNISDIRVGSFIPRDGQADPANVALALAKGARQRGAKIIENVKVTGVTLKNGRVAGVETASGQHRGGHRRQLCRHVGP